MIKLAMVLLLFVVSNRWIKSVMLYKKQVTLLRLISSNIEHEPVQKLINTCKTSHLSGGIVAFCDTSNDSVFSF